LLVAAAGPRIFREDMNAFRRNIVGVIGLAWLGVLSGCGPGPAATVAQQLQSENPSERMAACVTVARQNDRAALPLVVERLDDPSPDVRFCAIHCLEQMTGQTFGYKFYQEDADRQEAVQQWRGWLAAQAATKQGGKP
jgi:hypothetical protein